MFFMALDKIQGLGFGLNPFIKPKDTEDPSTSKKTGGLDALRSRRFGKHLAKGIEKKEEKQTQGMSFLKDGALGEDGAVYVKGGRAGGLQNFIA